jgi:hypothetical protein
MSRPSRRWSILKELNERVEDLRSSSRVTDGRRRRAEQVAPDRRSRSWLVRWHEDWVQRGDISKPIQAEEICDIEPAGIGV